MIGQLSILRKALRALSLPNLPLVRKLFVYFTVLVVTPILIVGIASYRLASEELLRENTSSSFEILQQAKLHIEYYLNDFEIEGLKIVNHPDMKRLLRMTSREEIVESGIEPEVLSRLQSSIYSRGDLSGISVVLEDLSVIDTYGSRGVYPADRFKEEYWYESVPANGRPIWIARNLGSEPVLSLVRRLVSPLTLQPVGLLVIDVNFKRLQEIVDTVAVRHDRYLYILDEKGHYVYHPQLSLIGQRADVPAEPDRQGSVSTGAGRQRQLHTFVPSITGFTIATVVSYSEITQGIRTIGWSVSVTVSLTLLAAYLLGMSFASGIVRPIRRLQRLMKQIETGNLNVSVPVESSDEIGQLTRGFNKMAERLNDLIEKVYYSKLRETEATLRHKETELQMLQSQINPHFLYNALQTIRGMALEKDTEEIADMAALIARLLRYNLKQGSNLATVREELQVCEVYLQIQKYRFESKLEYHVDVPAWAEKMSIVRFSLQPLIENSVIHGMEPGVGPVHIHIRASREGSGTLAICVEDNGVGIEPGKLATIQYWLRGNESDESRSGHIGMLNVHHRIRYLFGDAYGLSIDSRPGQGTSVCLRIPYHD